MNFSNAPTASVAGYQLLTQYTGAWPELAFNKMDYSFSRKTSWKTIFVRYKDQSVDAMPTQVVATHEFTIRMERWLPFEIEALEAFVDARKGSAYPFLFTAPDDNLVYHVRFLEDPQGYSVPAATLRTGELVLVTMGDFDNSIGNDAIYPPYVEGIPPSGTGLSTL